MTKLKWNLAISGIVQDTCEIHVYFQAIVGDL